MGIVRDPCELQADLVKEMAEALGSAGLRLEETLERVQEARSVVESLLNALKGGKGAGLRERLIEVTREHNRLVDKAAETRDKLLIQREACGFRIHREVDRHYPIPPKIRLDPP